MMVLLGFNMKTFIEWGNGVGGIVFWWGPNKNLVGGGGVDWGEYQFLSILDSSADFTISDSNPDG